MRDALASALIERFDRPDVRAIVLMGSHARGDAGPFSDVDLVRFVSEPSDLKAETHSYLIDGYLVVVSDRGPAEVENWFSAPEEASNVIGGLRSAQPLLDRDQTFAHIQARARSFAWDASMQQKADAWASRLMVGWIEEVHKGLEGLRRNDLGRLLNARHGCSWGLSRVVQVQRGVLLSGDNAFYDELADAVGWDSEWVRLRRIAFGISGVDGTAPSLGSRSRQAFICTWSQPRCYMAFYDLKTNLWWLKQSVSSDGR
ncbi:MAG TPA: nucleotidyltransferase domain-containing protein [Blastocatellia bacterium]|nr:nucleotidyltransferase domain-containing protein [Blastocatellia bacterium]